MGSNTRTALVLLSGGIHSGLALDWAKKNYETVEAIHFVEDHANPDDSTAASAMAQRFGVNLNLCDMTGSLVRQVDGYVPGRDAILLAIALNHAVALGGHDLVAGYHAPGLEPIGGLILALNGAAFGSMRLALMTPLATLSDAEVKELAASVFPPPKPAPVQADVPAPETPPQGANPAPVEAKDVDEAIAVENGSN